MVKRVITARLSQSLAVIKSVHLFTKNKISWQELRDRGVEFLVAPYKADAQLAYLSKNGSVQAVLIEDSDMLVVYRCGLVLSKLDGGTVLALGWGDIQNRIQDTMFHGLQGAGLHLGMVDLCILAGGDYLESLPGVGLKSAYKLLVRHGSVLNVMPGLQPPSLCYVHELTFIDAISLRRWFWTCRGWARKSRRIIYRHLTRRDWRTDTSTCTVQRSSDCSHSPTLLQLRPNWNIFLTF